MPRKKKQDETALTKQEVVVPAVSMQDFERLTTPSKLGDEPNQAKRLNFFKCAGCGKMHFRHAGYMELMVPLIVGGDGARVANESLPVYVCTSCKQCYVWYNSRMYDVTDQIDLKAWARTEEECHAATGPGGDC